MSCHAKMSILKYKLVDVSKIMLKTYEMRTYDVPTNLELHIKFV